VGGVGRRVCAILGGDRRGRVGGEEVVMTGRGCRERGAGFVPGTGAATRSVRHGRKS
jgi:hypothetical protein